MLVLLALMLAAFTSGVLNAVAGGGAFVTFPALLLAGLPPVAANASSTVALFPGQATSAWAYRTDIGDTEAVSVRTFTLLSAVGGLLGALLLLVVARLGSASADAASSSPSSSSRSMAGISAAGSAS